jgi:hypothetical protein
MNTINVIVIECCEITYLKSFNNDAQGIADAEADFARLAKTKNLIEDSITQGIEAGMLEATGWRLYLITSS